MQILLSSCQIQGLFKDWLLLVAKCYSYPYTVLWHTLRKHNCTISELAAGNKNINASLYDNLTLTVLFSKAWLHDLRNDTILRNNCNLLVWLGSVNRFLHCVVVRLTPEWYGTFGVPYLYAIDLKSQIAFFAVHLFNHR